MADPAPTQPTEDQVKAANQAEESFWQDDFKEEELVIPYKKDEKTESKEPAADAAKTKEDDGEASTSQEPEVELPPALTVEDPGEYKPADYSFEVTLKDGKTVKISTPEEAEKIADDPENFETPKQLMEFLNKQNKMQRNLDRDYDKWEAKKKEFDTQTAAESTRQETVEQYVKEFNYLVAEGLLPKVDAQYVDADWQDPEVAKQDGVKEQMAVMSYMVAENKKRAKAGVKLIDSIIDAFNGWQAQESKTKAADDHKAEGEARRAAGARVAGVSSSNQAPYVPKGIAVGNPRAFDRNPATIWQD